MPPRLQLLSKALLSPAAAKAYQPLAPFLYPCLAQQQRAASILSSLSDNRSAYNKKIRRGRGPSSGKGKTSGRGHKGQKQHGKVPVGFNGGQTPDEVVAGKRGFENIFSVDMSPINLNRIQYWINRGRLDPSKTITVRELNKSRCIHGINKDGVKLLARGKEELSSAVNIVVSRASAEAIAAVEKLGGTVTTRYYTPFALKKITAGQMDPINSLQSRIAALPATDEGAEALAAQMVDERRLYKYRLPDPVKRKDLEYYRDAAHRGYLSHLVQKGQGPSLFFRTPGSTRKTRKRSNVGAAAADAAKKSENARLW